MMDVLCIVFRLIYIIQINNKLKYNQLNIKIPFEISLNFLSLYTL